MAKPGRFLLLRLVLGVLAILLAGTAYQFKLYLESLDVVFSLRSEWWLLVLGLSVLSLTVFVLLLSTWRSRGSQVLDFVEKSAQIIERSRLLSATFLFVFVGIYPFVTFGPAGDTFVDIFPRLLMYILAVLVASVALKGLIPRKSYLLMLATSAIGLVLIHELIILFQAVSTYPFSMGWSEVSRYYYASLFFSEKLYGFDIPPTVLHPTRYLMQAVPFLINNLPLVAHRLWQVVLWLVFTTLAGVAFVRRLKIADRWQKWLLVAWSFLFWLVGPIYYHLSVPVILILWGFDLRKPWRNLLLVIIASAWAGVSRLNWYPVPAMLAATLYLLEQPKRQISLWRYLLPVFLWGISGTLVAFASQSLYVLLSGNNPGQFTSSFTSDLLWYRLLPSATYPLGVLTGAVLVALPFWILMVIHIRRGRGFGHYLRWLGIIAMLLVLFAGGLVVSVKIGGGSNLHNMDAFLALLLVVSGYLFAGWFIPETESTPKPVRLSPVFVAILILVPVLLLVTSGGPQHFPSQSETESVLSELDALTTEIVERGGNVLFITQRQLIMFDYIPNVPLIPEYETVFLMEMVMGGNRDYLDAFHADLESHRFDLIISDPMPEREKDADKAFSEEHNVWLLEVADPLQAVYQRVKLFQSIGIEVFAPKP
jgi:hypothetical protein